MHRGAGAIETDFGPLADEKDDYVNIPRAVTYRVVPEKNDNVFLIIASQGELEQVAQE